MIESIVHLEKELKISILIKCEPLSCSEQVRVKFQLTKTHKSRLKFKFYLDHSIIYLYTCWQITHRPLAHSWRRVEKERETLAISKTFACAQFNKPQFYKIPGPKHCASVVLCFTQSQLTVCPSVCLPFYYVGRAPGGKTRRPGGRWRNCIL